jgi:hypothetical protein
MLVHGNPRCVAALKGLHLGRMDDPIAPGYPDILTRYTIVSSCIVP